MSIVPGVPDTDATHPAWCSRKHKADWPVHERQVGGDLELSSDLAYGVSLQHVEGDASTQVLFMAHTPEETALTRLSIVEAGILRDLLSEALELVGRR